MHATTRRMHPLVLLLLLVIALAVPCGDAMAHVALVASEPAHESAYERAPQQIRLSFTDAVTPVALRLRDAQGRRYELPAPPRVDGAVIEAALPEGLPDAIYVLRWRVTAADSHPAQGTLVFAVATEIPVGFTAVSGGSDAAWHAVNVLLRLAVSASVLLAGGAVLFAMLVAPVDLRHRRVAARIAALGALAAVLAIPARGALLLDAEDLDLVTAWATGAKSSLATSMAIAGLGLAAIAGAWARRVPPPLVAALGAEAALVSFALSGHVATAEPRWLVASIIVAHVSIAAFWLGALPALSAQLRRHPALAAATIRRFSRLAFGGVGVLVLLGGTMAAIQVADPEALGTTPYGRILALKLVAFVALLTIAAGNRLLHTPALARGEPGAAHRLLRAIGWEKALFGAVLLSTATLSLTAPPRIAVAALAHVHVDAPQSDGVAATASAGRIGAVIEVVPGRAGRNRVTIDVIDADGRSMPARALIVEMAPANDGAPLQRLRPQPRSQGGYAIDGVVLDGAGRWLIRLEIAPSDAESETLTTEITIR
jgi:copper transport protein